VGSGEFLNINFFTALFTLANTVALILVLKKFLWGPVMKMIADRQQEIDDLYADAGRAKTEAQKMEQEYREKLDAAVQTGEKLVKEAVARGQSREEEIIRQANAEADAIRAKANADIAQEKKKAVNDAKNEISDLALAIAGKVVGRELTDADRSRLVDSFIDELGDGV
jgi:F-type H+-transporting ATPase subunit b